MKIVDNLSQAKESNLPILKELNVAIVNSKISCDPNETRYGRVVNVIFSGGSVQYEYDDSFIITKDLHNIIFEENPVRFWNSLNENEIYVSKFTMLDYRDAELVFEDAVDNVECNEYLLREKLQDVNLLVIPGDYYNLSVGEFTGNRLCPTPHRYVLQDKLLEISEELEIPFIGICGGFQYFAHSHGIEVLDCQTAVSGDDEHNRTFGDFHEILAIDLDDRDGILYSSFHGDGEFSYVIGEVDSSHSQCIRNSKENVATLNDVGLSVTGIASFDGEVLDNLLIRDGKIDQNNIYELGGIIEFAERSNSDTRPMFFSQFHIEYIVNDQIEDLLYKCISECTI